MAGFLSGMTFGSIIPTETERKLRNKKNLGYWSIIPENNIWAMLINLVVSFAIAAVILTIVAVSILKFTNAYPLSGVERINLVISLFAGVFFAKGLRFFYWLNKPRKR
jgi:hypothetical protein